MAHVDFLDCPVCDKPCEAIPPDHYDRQERSNMWLDGQVGTCACGAKLRVEADCDAWLIEETEDEP